MQYFADKDCDAGVKNFKTTSGEIKKIRLEFIADDGLCDIILRSRGRYKIKIGYNYTIIDVNGNIIKVLDRYHTEEKILEYYDSISIPNGWNAALDENEYEVLNEYDTQNAYPMKIDIISIVRLDERKQKEQKE